jgi:hypothetical protein
MLGQYLVQRFMYPGTYQKVMIIVMPMIPLANVAHLGRVSKCQGPSLDDIDIQHSLGERDRSILELFGHVRAGVWTDEAPNWA